MQTKDLSEYGLPLHETADYTLGWTYFLIFICHHTLINVSVNKVFFQAVEFVNHIYFLPVLVKNECSLVLHGIIAESRKCEILRMKKSGLDFFCLD